GEAATAEEAAARAGELRPDLVLMDLRLQGEADGIEACRDIRSLLPETRVLMLSAFGESDAVVGAIMAGAAGYVLKNISRGELLRALRQAAAGQPVLDPTLAGRVMRRLAEVAARKAGLPGEELTGREREVLGLVARGCTNKEIAQELVISQHTARNHVSHVLDKLGFTRRAEAAAYAARLGLPEEGPR
ncbi:MAG TPA: response regulator transcription factor, partial [Dehalococcoidia bacterium]|nr:response regulator transcription factor [Dehalococcoidia bacterium]